MRWAKKLRDAMRYSAEDLVRGKAFWVPVVLVTIPTIVGALQVSSHRSFLTVTLEEVQWEYHCDGEPEIPPDKFRSRLAGVVERKLTERVGSLFPKPVAGEDQQALSEAAKNALDALRISYPKMKVSARSKVTNIGSKPSALQSVLWYMIEETDGRRDMVDLAYESPGDVKLPESEPVEVGKTGGQTIGFGSGGWRATEYEQVRIVEENVRRSKSKNQPLFSAASPYLRLLSADEDRQEKLLRIADPSHKCRLLIGIEVTDIYGRMAHMETEILDSAMWNREKP